MKSEFEISDNSNLGNRQPIVDVITSLALSKTDAAKSVFIKLTASQATVQAENSAQRLKDNKPLGQLDGMRVVWKDLFDQKGEITTAGSKTRLHEKAATSDATVVRQLNAAGVCSIGRTNLSEFAFSGIGINPNMGTPKSALSEDKALIPGGSSSGSAVAVALGIAQIGMGTDTSGSIRIPAALNGVYGFRPSIDRYSKDGVFELSKTLDTVGTIASNLDDIIAVDNILTGTSLVNQTPEKSKILDLSKALNVAWDSEVYNSYMSALNAFEDEGYSVEQLELKAVSSIFKLFADFGTLVSIEAKRLHHKLLQSTDAQLMDPMVWSRLNAAPSLSEPGYRRYLEERNNLITDVNKIIGDAIIVCPTVPSIRHDAQKYINDVEQAKNLNTNILKATMIASFLDFPSLALPQTDMQGRVVGSIQISSAQGNDALLLSQCKNLDRIINQKKQKLNSR